MLNNRAKMRHDKRLQIASLVLGLTGMIVALGCTRERYRSQADKEVYSLVDCATTDPRWPVDDFSIQPDPKSRFYDPNNPDCPPMPPDDPTAHAYMECVDGKKAWRHWHDHGDTPNVENPDWMSYLPVDEEGVVELDREGVVRAARLHSLDYQRELEGLYLTALDVTFERFRFDCQYFGGNSTFYTADGYLRSGASTSRLDTDTFLEMRRLFAPGGELVVGVANSLVWQFAGPDSYGANTLLDFSLVQPLLRAGGRNVILENLTARERELLAQIRDFERFRNEFHIRVIGGSGGSRAGGYWALLRSKIEISNQKSNVADLQDSVNRFQAAKEAGRDSLQSVEQARQGLYDGQSQLLGRKAAYENSLELFLMSLGLPPDLRVRFDDNSLERFNLQDLAITGTWERIETELGPLRDLAIVQLPDDFRESTAKMRADCEPLLDLVEQDLRTLVDILPRRSADLTLLASRDEFKQKEVDSLIADVAELNRRAVERFAEFYGPEFPIVNDLVGRLLTSEEDLTWFQLYKKRQEPTNRNMTGLGARIVRLLLEIEAFEKAPQAFTDSINVAAREEQAADHPDVKGEPPDDKRRELRFTQPQETKEVKVQTPKEVLVRLVGQLCDRLLELSLIQARARLDTVTLVPIELPPQKALQTARTHRRDWMNARAELVDQWRQIEIRANALESSVDVTFSGDIGTTDNHPLKFRAPTGRLRVGMRFDAPLTRTEERNSYRRALINYQQARRNYYAFEDGVNQSLRDLLRTLRRNQLDFEITRQSVFIAITRVDVARISQEKPVSSNSQPRSTAGTRDLLDALKRLLSAQNSFLGAWVDYEVQRMRLSLDLGTMELDDRGMWIDPGPITDDTLDPQGLRVIPAPPGVIRPGTELTPPRPESVQVSPVDVPVSPIETSVPDRGARHASYAERIPNPPKARVTRLPPVR